VPRGDARKAGIRRHTGYVPDDYLDGPGPLAIAHRGGAAHGPENSWRAFQHAVGLGYRYLETDARATADGVLLAHHDPTLDRVTDRTGRLGRLDYSAVSAARIAGTEPIPKLEDLLGAWPDIRFNIDIKAGGAIRPLAEVLRRTAAWDRVCVGSFSPRRLWAARQVFGRPVCLAASPVGVVTVRYLNLLAQRLPRSGIRCVQVPIRVATRPFVRRAHALGLQVHVWTVNQRGPMARLLDLGADGIITDETVALRELLAERSQWHPRA
jgi:glycerophosphoryl diester phosphodiesterase